MSTVNLVVVFSWGSVVGGLVFSVVSTGAVEVRPMSTSNRSHHFCARSVSTSREMVNVKQSRYFTYSTMVFGVGVTFGPMKSIKKKKRPQSLELHTYTSLRVWTEHNKQKNDYGSSTNATRIQINSRATCLPDSNCQPASKVPRRKNHEYIRSICIYYIYIYPEECY